jgi:hypothetical protein
MLVRKGLRKGNMSGGCQFFTQVHPHTPAGKVASGAGEKNARPDKSLDRYFVIVPRERRPVRSMSKV